MHTDNSRDYGDSDNTSDDIRQLANLKPQGGVELLIVTISHEKELYEAIQSILVNERKVCRHYVQ